MPDVLNIVLYPLAPTDGADFQSRYLTGLTLSAYEVELHNPIPAAAAQPASNLIGKAEYNAGVTTLPFPPLPTAPNPILQHFVLPPPPPIGAVPVSVASAVVFLPNRIETGQPYVNVVLHLERAGTAIADRSINYDTPVVSLTFPINGVTVANAPPSLYVGLPPPAGAIPDVVLPEDGAPPPFDALVQAVNQVLTVDPVKIDGLTSAPGLDTLTPQQCTHIAREILWRRTAANPVPLAVDVTSDKVPLDELYTLSPPNLGKIDDIDKDRVQFQGALQSYYATLDANTARLAQYIYAMSAALSSSKTASDATSVELTFPVRSSVAAPAGQIVQGAIRLQG